MSNIKAEVVAFHDNYPNFVKWISGKWFDRNDNEIENIDKYFFELSIQREFYKDFLFFKVPDDIHKFEDLFITGYGDEMGMWPLPYYARKTYGCITGDLPLGDLPFPLTLEQLLIIGVMLYLPKEEVFFITTGVGGSGKSTFGNIVKQLFNNDVAHTSLDDLRGFKLAEAVKKRLIYSEEISYGELNCNNLKMLASKQAITVEPKYMTPIEVQSQSALLFNCNRAPKIDIEDTGIMRRLVFYRRDNKIDNPDLSLRDKEYSEYELITIARHAFNAIKEHEHDWRDFFKKDTFETLMKDNKVYRFYKMGGTTYDKYVEMCEKAHIKDRFIMSQDNWQKMVDFIQENDEEEKLPF